MPSFERVASLPTSPFINSKQIFEKLHVGVFLEGLNALDGYGLNMYLKAVCIRVRISEKTIICCYMYVLAARIGYRRFASKPDMAPQIATTKS